MVSARAGGRRGTLGRGHLISCKYLDMWHEALGVDSLNTEWDAELETLLTPGDCILKLAGVTFGSSVFKTQSDMNKGQAGKVQRSSLGWVPPFLKELGAKGG